MKKLCLCLMSIASISLAYADPREIRLSGEDLWEAQHTIDLRIESVDIEVKVHGTLARTRLRFAIFNPTDTEAQADLLIPLPPNSTVTGYALDIDGEMVDGVYVEKQHARYTYDSIVSQMIDPGLVEAKDDNSFSINVYPVLEKNKRIFSLEFITDMAGQPYALPLYYKGPVQEAALAIEVQNDGKLPVIKYPRGMRAKAVQKRNGFYIDKRRQNIELHGVLRIQNETSKRDRVLVEKSGNGEYYFVIDDYTQPPTATTRLTADRITVFWDASLSRRRADTGKELEILEKLIEAVGAGGITVDVVVFRNRGGEKSTFTLDGDASLLLDHLRSVPYDGASNLEAALQSSLHESNDYCLLFTDGQINYGSRNVRSPCPLYIIDSGTTERPYLEYLAAQSSGDYFALDAATPDSIAAQIGALPFRLLSVALDRKGTEEMYMDGVKPAGGYLRFAGRLLAPDVSITLGYGTGRNIVHSETFELKQAGAPQGENTRLLWAQNKIDALLHAATPDRQTIIEVSRRHGVLSPYTSLLVLESPEQYAEYGIEPPATKQDWVETYREMVETPDRNKQAHFDNVLKQWNELVAWWQTDFSRKPKPEKPPEIPPPPARVVASDVATDELSVQEVIVSGIRGSDPGPSRTGPRISVKPWNPDRVYLSALGKAGEERYFEKYLALREEHGQLPAYYLEVADFLRSKNRNDLALQVLSNLVELETSDYTIRRVLGYKLIEYRELDLAIHILETVLRDNAIEPQSYRDLALALVQRADERLEESRNEKTLQAAQRDYLRALDLLYHVVLEPWDGPFDGIEMVALVEINRLIAKCKSLGINDFNVDQRLIKRLDVDLRVVAAWHADNVDIDLWLIEPTGETAKYDNPLTAIGGRVSDDMIQGFGPEEYMLKKAVKGKYVVKVHYYGSEDVIPTGAVKVMVAVYTDYARNKEKREVLTIELENEEDQYLVGEIEF